MTEAGTKIATLLAADVADYTRLIASSDSEIPQILEARRELFLRLVSEHDGHCFTTAGTSHVAEFPNASSAVRCAVAIQRSFLKDNEPLPIEQRPLLRIGLHVGEVAERDGNPYGDGIDLAIKLEGLAVPGGICLTRAVYEQIRHKAHVGVEFAGEKRIKNVPEPVAIYQVIEPGVDKGYFSLWTELKRRNVFKVGTAYTVISWLLIQVASIIFPTFDAPLWVMQALLSILVLGFPIALVLAWVYEITPFGLKRSDEVLRQASIRRLTGRRFDRVTIGLLVLIVVFMIFDNYVPLGVNELEAGEPESVAVLAFVNQGADQSDEYFADGLADELLSVLARVPEIRVASRTASFYYKGKDVDIVTIAETLGVDSVLSGSVRRDGDRVRVTAALDDPATGNLLWSQTYDRTLEDIFDIQSDIARSVAAAIVPVLSPQSQGQILARPTESTEAYDYYLRGRDYLRQPVEERTLASAIELFGRAIDLDPRFAQAYAGLCEAQLGSFEFVRNTEFFERAEISCHRSLTLNNSLWEVHVALGNLYRVNGQYDRAILELETAIAQQPNAVSPYLALSLAYEAQGSLEQAEATLSQAEEIESGYWGIHRAFGNFLYRSYRFNEAIERYVKVTELVPDNDVGYNNLASIYVTRGDLAQAERVFSSAPEPTRWIYSNRGIVHYYLGNYEQAVEDQQRAVVLAPDWHESWGLLGDAYRFIDGAEQDAQDAYENAIELAEKRLAINPADWDSIGRLAVYYAHTGRLEEAAIKIDAMLALSSDSDALYRATLVSLLRGDIERVYEYLQRTIEGGWSRALLAEDPDLATLRGQDRYESLLAEP